MQLCPQFPSEAIEENLYCEIPRHSVVDSKNTLKLINYILYIYHNNATRFLCRHIKIAPSFPPKDRATSHHEISTIATNQTDSLTFRFPN